MAALNGGKEPQRAEPAEAEPASPPKATVRETRNETPGGVRYVSRPVIQRTY